MSRASAEATAGTDRASFAVLDLEAAPTDALLLPVDLLPKVVPTTLPTVGQVGEQGRCSTALASPIFTRIARHDASVSQRPVWSSGSAGWVPAGLSWLAGSSPAGVTTEGEQ